MDSTALLRAGDPAGALEALKQEVRQAPRDPRLRVFLFQLFCVTGTWDRALTQLTAAAELDPLALPMAQTYRAAIRCEILRERVFAGQTTPTIFGQPEPWMSLLIEANRRLASNAPEILPTGNTDGAPGGAQRLRDAAFEAAPASTGTLDGTPFTWIADADPRLGPMLEAIVDGRYSWIPFHRLARIDIDPPADLRDQVWMPAHFTFINAGETVGFIPTRYPGSAAAADPALMLARRTEFRGEDAYCTGLGQRMLATDEAEYALQDIRCIEITPAALSADVPDANTIPSEPGRVEAEPASA